MEHRALHQALARLPSGALIDGPEPLTPSVRAVLDRFLSAQLRGPLRALGAPEGPAAVSVERLGYKVLSAGAAVPDSTAAVVGWLIEAAGLFRPSPRSVRAEDRRPRSEIESSQGGPAHISDHLLLMVRSQPPATVGTVGFASVVDLLAALSPDDRDLLRQPVFSQRQATGGPHQPKAPQALTGDVPNAGFLADPRSVLGLDRRAEGARQAVLAAVELVASGVRLTVGTAVLVDRRRAVLTCDRELLSGPWMVEVDLVADPWSSKPCHIEHPEGVSHDRHR